ncbi:MAG: hypothetical protein COU25_02155 [Candidatus Levybacteria bacterium CG10_big_fil_rev_8_21_14_0_10_35_13]|nr:MAG: hypothetical protein COU25_02155 [Candidatus Levybacteria bacterium CG10_big_fil_rev_8_21_14_0_10_35_13]
MYKKFLKKPLSIKVIITILTAIVFLVTLMIYFYSTQYKDEFESGKIVIDTKIIKATTSAVKTSTVTPTPSQINESNSPYPLHRAVVATMFWVGEKASGANDYIPNESSAWDKDWLDHFGGIDNPYSRSGYYPSDFKPKENPFYFALPFNDFDEVGKKTDLTFLPWYSDSNTSALKNKWIKIIYKGKVCYGQWEDVGPFEQNDFEYVFGNKAPKNSRAGIDISPALRTCLEMVSNNKVDWQFIDEVNVPSGPWKETVTTSQLNW